MNLRFTKTIVAAAMSLSLVFFASAALAQMALAGTSMGWDTAGLPGTEAPQDPAPIGAISSDWMSHENAASRHHALSTAGHGQIQREKAARLEEEQLVRQIVRERVLGHNVDAAARQQWLGTISLARGDRTMAENYFHQAELDLKANRTASSHIDALGLGGDPNAVNLHPNTGVAVDY
jgi:hypothetical protein